MSKRFGVAAGILLLCSCASDGRVVASSRPAVKVDPAPIYLVAARQKSVIEESLRAAGIPLTRDLAQATYLLRATVGNAKGWRSCGSVNNVKFDLRKGGKSLLLLSGSGPTGDCSPSAFDSLSTRLKDSFVGSEPNASQSNEVH